MTGSPPKTVPDKPRIFLFKVADQIFGLSVGDVGEVIHMAELIAPPGRPAFLSGFVNMDGQAIAVVDLAVLLGFSAPPIQLYTPLVIMNSNKFPVALIVARVLGLEPISGQRMTPLDDASIFNRCVTSSGKTENGDAFYLLSPEKIMLTQERQLADEFQKMVQKRLDSLKTKDAEHV